MRTSSPVCVYPDNYSCNVGVHVRTCVRTDGFAYHSNVHYIHRKERRLLSAKNVSLVQVSV